MNRLWRSHHCRNESQVTFWWKVSCLRYAGLISVIGLCCVATIGAGPSEALMSRFWSIFIRGETRATLTTSVCQSDGVPWRPLKAKQLNTSSFSLHLHMDLFIHFIIYSFIWFLIFPGACRSFTGYRGLWRPSVSSLEQSSLNTSPVSPSQTKSVNASYTQLCYDRKHCRRLCLSVNQSCPHKLNHARMCFKGFHPKNKWQISIPYGPRQTV